MILHLIALVLALVCFGLAASGPGAPYWNRLVALGLAALVASMLAV